MSDKPEFLTDKELQTCLEYLDDLRANSISIREAYQRLLGEFSEGYLTPDEAKAILLYWIQTFSERHPEVVR